MQLGRRQPMKLRAPRDSFPSTRFNWIRLQLAEGEPGRLCAAQHIMESYAEPLERYAAGSSFRSLGEPKELVHGYFASRLTRLAFFEDWNKSDLPLRRWLINGFLFYLQEVARKNRALPNRTDSFSVERISIADRDNFDRMWAVALVARALDRAKHACGRRDQELHWTLFEGHMVHGRPYSSLLEEHGVTAREAATLVRTAAMKFRQAVFDLLERDGVKDAEIEHEIVRLMEALKR